MIMIIKNDSSGYKKINRKQWIINRWKIKFFRQYLANKHKNGKIPWTIKQMSIHIMGPKFQ